MKHMMNMKHITNLFILLFILILTMTGCGNNEERRDRVNSGNSVDNVISEQMEKAGAVNGNTTPENKSTDAVLKLAVDAGTTEQKDTSAQNTSGVDYDLTTMSSDMVYATVYQLMVNPDAYIGKTFRMDGLYYGSYYEPTEQYYHYCIIQDATFCCAQGLEFMWDDGSHVYPDEYPEENTAVVVQGVFETYREDGDTNLYCRLKDATLEAADN